MEGRKFQNHKFITCGVAEQIPMDLQLILWTMIDEVSEQDYIQVFDISISNGQGKIRHTQEVPKYENEVTFNAETAIDYSGRVFVIDDETHSTMLLPEEY